MEFIVLVALIVAAFWARTAIKNLERRALSAEAGLADLRAKLDLLARGSGPLPAAPAGPLTSPLPQAQPTPPAASSEVPPPPPPEATRPPSPESPSPPSAQSVPSIAGAPVASSPAPDLEQRLGTRWAVWVGALALSLGGLLLVRYSIESGLIGPGTRIVLGLILAAALAIAGEHMRRRERALEIPVLPAAHIPSALTSAATVVALGTIYAAHAIYGFIGPAFAFVSLGAVALAALAAAAIHGPALAGVGLLGAYAVPALVSSSDPNPWPVVIYLAVVGAAAYGLARLRVWLWLAGGAIAGAMLWSGILMSVETSAVQVFLPAAMAHVLVQLALAAFFFGIEPHADRADANAAPDWIGHAALAALALIAFLMIFADSMDPARPVVFALIAVVILVTTGLMAVPVAGAFLLAGVLALAALLQWTGVKVTAAELPYYLRDFQQALQLPERIGSFLTFAALVPLAIAGSAAWRLYRGSLLPVPTAGLLAAAATLPPLLALVIAYLRVTQFDHSIRFALAGAALAAIFAIAAEAFQRAEGRERTDARRIGTGAFAAAAIAALALALTCGLERGYLTVSFALAALGAAYVAVYRDIPLLRHAVTALGAIVLVRVFIDPRIMGADVGKLPLFNWLLFGYGVPALAFAWSARLLATRTDDVSVKLSDSLAVIFSALLIGYQIRHFLYAGDVLTVRSSHVEAGLQTTASLGLSYALSRLDLARGNIVFRWASIIFGIAAAATAFVALGMTESPLFNRQLIAGPPWFSSLGLAYLLPGAMAVLAARAAREVRPAWYVNMLAVLAVLLLLSFVTLEVRHMFQGQIIYWTRRTSGAEQWAYSVAWLVLGLLFLAYGVVFRSKPARLASAALVILSVLKVFLLDLQGLTGLWRALSFISLGLVLIGIGLVYQRLLFQPRAQQAAVPRE